MRNIKIITISFIILTLTFSMKSYASLQNEVNTVTNTSENNTIINTNIEQNNEIKDTEQNNSNTSATNDTIKNEPKNNTIGDKLETDTTSDDISSEDDSSDDFDDSSIGDLDDSSDGDDSDSDGMADNQEPDSDLVQSSIDNQQRIASQTQTTSNIYSNQKQNLLENTQTQNKIPHTGIGKEWIIPGGVILIFNAVVAIQKIKKYRGI